MNEQVSQQNDPSNDKLNYSGFFSEFSDPFKREDNPIATKSKVKKKPSLSEFLEAQNKQEKQKKGKQKPFKDKKEDLNKECLNQDTEITKYRRREPLDKALLELIRSSASKQNKNYKRPARKPSNRKNNRRR